ncbi:class I SAM-dependent methyltransferase [Dokdonella sp.]|uniref:class I SAM-dependent methyltransferase n=1 Tax=Dokdonella sp. TaxID=2291710 RepID=UPI0035273A4A
MSDRLIIERWNQNSAPWTSAVREGRIESRVRVTDAAIVDAIMQRKPGSVLDIGCGEGWLARALSALDVDVLGIDVVPALIESARQAKGGRYAVISQEELARGAAAERFDVCVCNFSLLGGDVVEHLIAGIHRYINPGGAFIVQTLHPGSIGGGAEYRDGWREGSWAGIDAAFSEPAPWYFRTLQTWVSLYRKAGLRIEALQETTHPDTHALLSIILVGAPERATLLDTTAP